MTTLSIEHAKHIVRLRHKDAYCLTAAKDVAVVLSLSTGDKTLGQGRIQNEAWIDAALRILADPEFWLDDERVVRAAIVDPYEYDDGSIWNAMGNLRLGISWKTARNNSAVQSFEQQYRPKKD